jgi:DNA-binding transcriptional LysR family regulator
MSDPDLVEYPARMSVEQLETVVAIAEEGSLTAAARRLHISQPPITRRLAALEDEIGARLFDRLPRGMRLTASGQLFLQHARDALAAMDRARQVAAHPRPRG